MSRLFYISHFLAIASFLLYMFFGKKSSGQNIMYFIFFLFCMFIFDTLGIFLAKYGYNNAFYNLLSLLEFNLLFLFYRSVSKNTLTKRYINIATILYVIVYFFSSIYFGIDIFSSKFNTVAPVIGSILIGVVLMLYLRELLLSERVVNYKTNIFFWITTGLLLYYIGTIPLTAMLSFFKKGSAFASLFKIQFVLTIIMHSCFLFGLLWSLKKVK